MKNLKVMIRDENAKGLDFQASLYIDNGHYHDLVAEVYTIERANFLVGAVDALAALEAVEWVEFKDDDPGYTYFACTECAEYKEDGHTSVCKIGAAIAKAKGEME